tara:strand:+ start:306 stop:548 length:243 start_codon:yes stop_codon:yes gene_type:complete
MAGSSNWLSGDEASKVLRVDPKTLDILRERGYLKPGSHWRSSTDPAQLPWKPKAFYCLSGCKEVIELLLINQSSVDQIAA